MTELQKEIERLEELRRRVADQKERVAALARRENAASLENVSDADLQLGAISLDLEAQRAVLAELERRFNAQRLVVARARVAEGTAKLQPSIAAYDAEAEKLLAEAEQLAVKIDTLSEQRAAMLKLADTYDVPHSVIESPSLAKIASAIRYADICWRVYTGERYSVVSEQAPQELVQVFQDGKREIVTREEAAKRTRKKQGWWSRWSGEITTEIA